MRGLFLMLSLILAGCTRVHDNRLVGTWVSDREGTLSYNRSLRGRLDWKKYSPIFGRLRVTYDDASVIADLDGVVKRESLRIVRRDADTVTLRVYDPIDHKDKVLVVHFVDSDTYWIHIRDSDYREYFRRVTPPGDMRR
jgi:hypothetical protein